MKLVSIIVPVYNLEKYIENTLESIINQTYRNIELIVVNDGSKDRSLDIIKGFLKDKDIKNKVISIENSGVSSARNKGLDEAHGDYIIFLDGDDRLKCYGVKKLVDKAEESDADVCFCGYEEYVDFQEEPVYRYSSDKHYIDHPASGIEALNKKLRKDIWICTGNGMYKRDMLLKYSIRYSEGLSYGEDLEFIGKCLFHAHKVVSVEEELLQILIRSSSALNSKFSIKYADALITNRNFYSYVESCIEGKSREDIDTIKANIDYDYVNIFMGVTKKVYEGYSVFHPLKAVKTFNDLNLSLDRIDLKNAFKNIDGLKNLELRIFLFSKVLYFYCCKVFNVLRR